MRITYHAAKRDLTLKHRGQDFADAGQVFRSPSFTIEDDRKDYGEARFQTIGRLDEHIVMVVWTPRPRARHIISMRHCNAKERQSYKAGMDRP